MSSVIVLDSCVAGYFVAPHPKEGQEQRAAESLRLLVEAKASLILPAPALAEVLVQLSPDQRDLALDKLSSLASLGLRVFDILAARAAAHLGSPKAPPGGTHQHVKVDVQIVACAFRYGADGICTFDPDIAAIAARGPRALTIGPPIQFLRQVPMPTAQPVDRASLEPGKKAGQTQGTRPRV